MGFPRYNVGLCWSDLMGLKFVGNVVGLHENWSKDFVVSMVTTALVVQL
jgi:hypothetical protein